MLLRSKDGSQKLRELLGLNRNGGRRSRWLAACLSTVSLFGLRLLHSLRLQLGFRFLCWFLGGRPDSLSMTYPRLATKQMFQHVNLWVAQNRKRVEGSPLQAGPWALG